MSAPQAIVPRWEWRTFGRWLELPPGSQTLAPGPVRESDEVYVLSPGGASVKYRDDAVDVKELVQVNAAGLEQWRPTLKASLPLSAEDAGRLVDALGVAPPALRRRPRRARAAAERPPRPGGAVLRARGLDQRPREPRGGAGGRVVELT